MPVDFKVLLIEDDPDDIEFLREALNEHGPPYTMETLTRGDLVNSWMSSTTYIPHIIIMDLNLPRTHGREVLCQLRANEKLALVPLVVLTTSSLSEDKDYCLAQGADQFLTKPSSPEGFRQLIEVLTSFVNKSGLQSGDNHVN